MYSLQKYAGSSSRHTCPSCQRTRCFTLYVDEQNQPLDSRVGICNHSNSCAYHYTPKQYFQDNPDKKNEYNPTNYQPKKTITKPLSTIPKHYLINSISYRNNFIQFLCTIIDPFTLQSPIIQRIVSDYMLGSTRRQEVIYWQVDTKNRIRTGKIQAYNPTTGKRIKEQHNAINWVHSKLKKSGHLPQDWQLTQCLFGEHLLTKYPHKTVALVEGEKNAIIASALFPDYIWLATGGKQNFKPDLLRPLSNRTVIIFPDADAHEEWTEKAKQLTFCKAAIISDLIKRSATTPTYDLTDYLIHQLRNQTKNNATIQPCNNVTTLQTLLNMNPTLQTLIDTLNLHQLTPT